MTPTRRNIIAGIAAMPAATLPGPRALLAAGFPDRPIRLIVPFAAGTPITVATSGVGSATHMTLERLKAASGANFTHVPYRGTFREHIFQ